MRMRLVLLPFALLLALPVQRAGGEPFVGIGVWYAAPGAKPPETANADVETLHRDLTTLRRAGFNAITSWISWRETEPRQGAYSLSGVERLVAAAAAADLRVALVAYTDPAPEWAARSPDAADRFVRYVTKRLSLQSAVLGVSTEPTRGRIDVRPGAAPEARVAMWSLLARGERYVAFAGTDDRLSPAVLSLGETAGVVTRNQALFAPLRPRTGGVVDINGAEAGARVEVRMLESADALVIIGLNYTPAPRKVTITFAPDIPEAIWQNLETGTAVSFVMGKEGPFLEATFGARDALVLMIRKRLR